MKKNLKVFVALALVLSIALCLVACGGSSGITGKYKLVRMEQDGEVSIDYAAMEKTVGDLNMYLKLNKDGTAVLNLGDESKEMEYKDGEIWEVETGVKYSYTIKNGTFSMTQELAGYTMVFEK